MIDVCSSGGLWMIQFEKMSIDWNIKMTWSSDHEHKNQCFWFAPVDRNILSDCFDKLKDSTINSFLLWTLTFHQFVELAAVSLYSFIRTINFKSTFENGLLLFVNFFFC